jgi:hypothetical protein
MREVKILFNNDDIVVATEGAQIAPSAFYTAVGRLSTWADYPRVELYLAKDGEITAVYRDGEGERRYVIGAVWHQDEEGGHYGFHS